MCVWCSLGLWDLRGSQREVWHRRLLRQSDLAGAGVPKLRSVPALCWGRSQMKDTRQETRREGGDPFRLRTLPVRAEGLSKRTLLKTPPEDYAQVSHLSTTKCWHKPQPLCSSAHCVLCWLAKCGASVCHHMVSAGDGVCVRACVSSHVIIWNVLRMGWVCTWVWVLDIAPF